jgi:hypothetical protein
MTTPRVDPEPASGTDEVHVSRLGLLWDVLVFQFKLLMDGARDVLLSPLSIIAAVYGILAGGDRPDRAFRRLLVFGRRTEVWINLFGHHRGSRTSDTLLDGLRTRVMDEAQRNPWISKAGRELNRRLDAAGSRQPGPPAREPDDDEGPRP